MNCSKTSSSLPSWCIHCSIIVSAHSIIDGIMFYKKLKCEIQNRMAFDYKTWGGIKFSALVTYFEVVSMESKMGHFARLDPSFALDCGQSIAKDSVNVALEFCFSEVFLSIVENLLDHLRVCNDQLSICAKPLNEVPPCLHKFKHTKKWEIVADNFTHSWMFERKKYFKLY